MINITPSAGYINGEKFLGNGRRTGVVFQEGRLVEKAIGMDDANPGQNSNAASSSHIPAGAYCGYFLPFFGHLLTEFLPRYEQLRIIKRLDLPVIVHPASHVMQPEIQLPNFSPIPEFLKEFGIPFEQLYFCVTDVEVRNLWHTSNAIRLNHSVGIEMTEISQSLNARYNIKMAGNRVFFSRSRLDDRFRKSENSEEVDEMFKEFGFCVLHPQDLPLRQQILAVCSASILAGEEGSALHLSMFNPLLRACIILDSGRFTRAGAQIDTQRLLNDRLGCKTIYCLPSSSSGGEMQAGGRFVVDIARLFKILTQTIGRRTTVQNKIHTQTEQFSRPIHSGEHYQHVLKKIHELLSPATYFEIGTAEGKTLELAKCASISVDPMFQIANNVIGRKPSCQLFQTDSDEFFSMHKPDQIFGAPIEFAFLDGMHLFEFLLRDFINTEKYCSKSSLVVMHDCIPTDSYLARRDPNDLSLSHVSPHVMWWAGDVWKVVAILKKYRCDLNIIAFDAPPTGLVCITNLDPNSRYLANNYDNIVKEFSNYLSDKHSLEEYWNSLNIIDTKSPDYLHEISVGW